MRTIAVLASGAALFVMGNGAAWAACEPMTLRNIADSIQSTYADLDGSGGPSAGDKRSGHVQLIDANDNPAGTHYWLITVREVDADGNATAMEADSVFALDDGALFVTMIVEPAVAFDEMEATVAPAMNERRITGGTGAYAGATGSMSVTVDGLDFTFDVDVTCE